MVDKIRSQGSKNALAYCNLRYAIFHASMTQRLSLFSYLTAPGLQLFFFLALPLTAESFDCSVGIQKCKSEFADKPL